MPHTKVTGLQAESCHAVLNRRLLGYGVVVGSGPLVAACSRAEITSVKEEQAVVGPRPAIIYVQDFEIEQSGVRSESLLSGLPIHQMREHMEAASLAAEICDAIVSDLEGKGLRAVRLQARSSIPSGGWLVRGVFLQIDGGDRLRRAVIGFGSGHTDLQVAVAIDALGANPTLRPLYEVRTDATSSKLPGAVVTLNPYVAGVKFLLAGRDLDRSTHQTAAKIANEVASRVDRH